MFHREKTVWQVFTNRHPDRLKTRT